MLIEEDRGDETSTAVALYVSQVGADTVDHLKREFDWEETDGVCDLNRSARRSPTVEQGVSDGHLVELGGGHERFEIQILVSDSVGRRRSLPRLRD